MIEINGIQYNLELIDILNELKNQLATQGYTYFRQIRDLPDDLMISCPFHKDGQERRASCGIRKIDGWCHCFTCNASTTLAQMISRCWGRNDFGQFGLQWLRDNFLGEADNNRDFKIDVDRIKNKSKTSKYYIYRYVTEQELEKYRYWHPYMEKRKLTDDVIDLFDIGYDNNTKCLTFPVKDIYGHCLFVARRSVNKKYFNYPSNVEKPVYGLYELSKQKEFPKEIYICESMIDALTLWGIGKYAVALNGLGTEKQFEQLNKLPCRKFILATDNDDAGRNARLILRHKLKNKLVTEILLPPNRKDINECSFEELRQLQEVM